MKYTTAFVTYLLCMVVVVSVSEGGSTYGNGPGGKRKHLSVIVIFLLCLYFLLLFALDNTFNNTRLGYPVHGHTSDISLTPPGNPVTTLR